MFYFRPRCNCQQVNFRLGELKCFNFFLQIQLCSGDIKTGQTVCKWIKCRKQHVVKYLFTQYLLFLLSKYNLLGQNYATTYDACYPNPCQNGATCSRDYYYTRNYYCSCPRGYSGQNCEYYVGKKHFHIEFS